MSGVTHLFTSNGYLKQLLGHQYTIIHPVSLIPKEKQLILRASEVRYNIALGEPWESLVPEVVSTYILKNKLDSRIRTDFGEELIETLHDKNLRCTESAIKEAQHVRGIYG